MSQRRAKKPLAGGNATTGRISNLEVRRKSMLDESLGRGLVALPGALVATLVVLVLIGVGCAEEVQVASSTGSNPGSTDSHSESIQVVHPFLDEMGMYATVGKVEVVPSAEASIAALPDQVPALALSVRPPESTDLKLGKSNPQMVPTALQWEDHDIQQTNDEFFGNMSNQSVEELRRQLPTKEEMSRTAQTFMAEHGLFDEVSWVLGPPQVHVGGTWQGEGDPVAIDWIAEWRDPELADLGSDVHVRIGANGEVYRLHWDVREEDIPEGMAIRLRPVSEVLTDPEAWHEGDITGDLSQLASNLEGPPLDLRIVDVSLARVSPFGSMDPAARYAVPVYAFEVEVTGPARHAGTEGVWRVVAAQNVSRPALR